MYRLALTFAVIYALNAVAHYLFRGENHEKS